MDLNVRSESSGDVRDWSWLGSSHAVGSAKDVTVLLAGADEETHYPDGFIKAGTLLARYSGGANDGLWAPYVHDHSGGFDLDTARAIVLDGFNVNKSNGVVTSTKVAGSVLLDGYPVEIVLANLPGLLEDDGTTAHTPVAADLPSTFFTSDR